MEIAKVRVTGTRAQTVTALDIPEGIVGATVSFEFGPEWAGLTKNVVFVGAKDVGILNIQDSAYLPPEVVTAPNIIVRVGIVGVDANKKLVIPTLWADLGTVKPGAPVDMGYEPTLPIWAQLLNMIGDLRYLNTQDKSNLVAAVNEAMSNSGGVGGYYTPVVTQPTANTMKIFFVPSVATMPAVEPVTITLPGSDSGQNGDQNGLSATASALLITILRNGVYSIDQSANITALAAELKVTEPEQPDEPVVPEVTLSSISATYNGGDVTVGTAVSALTGIVVTAHYSDGTSETVTDYTLSGEIAEGENIITVTYGDKTATFTVTGAVAEYTTIFTFPLVQGLIQTTAKNGYLLGGHNSRVSYVGTDCTLTPGKSYRLVGLDGVRYGVQIITESGYEKIQRGVDLSGTDKLDCGWQSSGYEFVADDAAVCAWVTASFSSGDITPEQAMPVYLQEVV